MPATLLGFRRIQTIVVVPENPALGLAAAFAFDAVTDMQETSPGQAFRHPLQNGYEGITDGTRIEPEEFTCTGIVTDTPVRFLLPVVPQHPGAVALYEQIKAIRRLQTPVTVVSSLTGVITGRWPEVITGKRGAGQGASIEISVNFVKFNIVYTQLVPAQVDADVLLAGSQVTTAQPF
jgi:hypothetical protein